MLVDPSRSASLTAPMLRIQYKLKAQVIGPDFVIVPVKHTIPIELFLAVLLPIVPSQVYKEEMVDTCCCYGGKMLKCTAITNKNAYAAGENINVTVLTDASQFTKDLNVSVKLIQNFIPNTYPEHPPSPCILQSATMPVIPAGKRVQNTVMLSVPLVINQSNLGGVYIKWHFCISVSLNATCSRSIELRVPITIYGLPKLPQLAPIVLPPGADPQVHELIILDPSKAIHPY